MEEPIVSVIIPVYNAEKFLKQCLNSVISQTLKEIEIICVDDGSTDNTNAILKAFSEKDQRITVIHQQNAGAGAARNNGLRRAKGKYLSFLDADDFFEKTMLERAVSKIEEDQAEFVVFRCNQYLEDQKKFKNIRYSLREETLPPYLPFNFRQITGNVFKTFVGWAWDKVYLREFVEKNQLLFQEQRTSNDMLFVFSALVLAKKITYLNDVLAHQRRNNEHSLSNTREKSWFCFYNALCALRDFLKKNNLYDELEKDFINYALHFSLWNLNTISGSCYYKLYDKLKKEWFCNLQIVGHEREYFYNQKEYHQFCKIMQYDVETYNTELSVIIPVYNAEKYIRKCLESVLSQKNINLEVICVDDCSTDNTREILEEFEQKYDNLIVIHNETNMYAGESRNRGLMMAKGQYIHFLDADDFVISDSYSKLYKIADDNRLDWLKTIVEGFDDKTQEKVYNRLYNFRDVDRWLDGKLLDFKHFPKKFFDIAVVPWNGIYKRQFLIDNGIRFNNLFCVNDRSFYVTVCIKASRMMVVRIPFIKHRMNMEDSLIGKRAQHFDCQFRSYELMEKICDENKVSNKVRFEILEHEMFDIFVWYEKFIKQNALSDKLKNDMKYFLTKERITYFLQFGEKSRWLKFRDLIEE